MSFVVMIGDSPLAVASSLAVAQVDALQRATQYSSGSDGEYRWHEHDAGEWRLVGRLEGRKRFSWTLYRVATVPSLDAAGGAA